MILFFFVPFLSAELNKNHMHDHFDNALASSKGSAFYIFTKISREPVAHYENDHNDGLENLRSHLVKKIGNEMHRELGSSQVFKTPLLILRYSALRTFSGRSTILK